MRARKVTLGASFLVLALIASTSTAEGQTQQQTTVSGTSAPKWSVDFGFGIDFTVLGNVNSGAIGVLQGQATAILPQPYGDVYGTGIDFRAGGGYRFNEFTEVRGVFTWQSADADLVRLGDIGVSPLYAQYTDYKSLGLDFGVRRYFPLQNSRLSFYGEGLIGVAFVDNINVQLAAPAANVIFNETDFYDQSAAFTWNLHFGALFPVSANAEINVQFGLRGVSGLPDVDQLAGTGLEDINNDSGRVTFPIFLGVRFRF